MCDKDNYNIKYHIYDPMLIDDRLLGRIVDSDDSIITSGVVELVQIEARYDERSAVIKTKSGSFYNVLDTNKEEFESFLNDLVETLENKQ